MKRMLSKWLPRSLLSVFARPSRPPSAYWVFENNADLHRKLQEVMRLYRFLTAEQQAVIRDFVHHFYIGKEVLAHPDVVELEAPLLAIAANAALVGAAQKTHYFSTVKWIYLCADDLEVDGDAYASSTVRLDSDVCLEESVYPRPGTNLVVHEFAHILDAQLGLSSSTPGLRDGFQRYVNDLQSGRWVPIADCFHEVTDLTALVDSQDAAFHTDVEFFASVSEAFFTNARELRDYDRRLYRDLVSIYGLDLAPLNWDDIWQP